MNKETDFVVERMSSDDAECVVDCMVIDVDLGDGLRRATGDPAFVVVIIHHH